MAHASHPNVDLDHDYWPVTRHSIDQAKQAQARERAAFTESTGVPLTDEGVSQRAQSVSAASTGWSALRSQGKRVRL